MISITFDKKFYKADAVRKTVEEYRGSEAAEFEMEEAPDFIRVAISDIDPEVQDVIREEFCNYALSQTICLL